ncbi:hypothetical protein [Rossellomorea marisflavi]|uniref:hypothetical protein n=1 Tax=Rossellomorea marisflavi TaxID=189381 RepID=UPI00295EA573|nr:hypothetical protein [Rossellomorea marisflavi]
MAYDLEPQAPGAGHEEKRKGLALRRQALDGLSRKAFLAFLISTAYDLEPQAPEAGHEEKRKGLALRRQA